jgi:hypothetical protein
VRLRLEGVPEEDEGVEAALGDPSADLEVSTQRARAQPLHVQPEVAVQPQPRGPRRDQLALDEQLQVVGRPLQQVVLAMVVGDQRHPRDAEPVSRDHDHHARLCGRPTGVDRVAVR